MLRGWHGIHVRFGANTLKPFGAPSEPGVALHDIGPVWERWQGDAGDTFVVGSDAEMERAALYRYADARAQEMGWKLNLDMNGHRLADFPHAALHKGPLAAAPFAPSTNLWVLAIQIRHPTRPFSAFYEDRLLEDALQAG